MQCWLLSLSNNDLNNDGFCFLFQLILNRKYLPSALIVEEIEAPAKLFFILKAAFTTKEVINMAFYTLIFFSLLRYDYINVFFPYCIERISNYSVPLLSTMIGQGLLNFFKDIPSPFFEIILEYLFNQS